MELHVVAVDDDRVGIERRQPPELAIDQLKPPHHVLGILVRPVAEPDVLLDRARARGQDDRPIRIPPVADREHVAQRGMVFVWILGHVRFERDARAFEEDHPIVAIARGGVAVIRVIERAEIRRHAHRVAAFRQIFEHQRLPDAFLALTVGAVVIEVAELPHQGALANPRAADNRHAHRARIAA